MWFTDSPYEKFMTQIPDGRRAAESPPPSFPPGHPCHGCAYGRDKPCLGICYRKLMQKRSDFNAVSDF